MGDLSLISNIDNLRRAWRWTKSNSDPKYKSYFRHLYRNYSVPEEELLRNLSDRLRRGVYATTTATKLFIPKSSGILRPISLLTVEDQIVYQAAANIIAERLLPHVKEKYNVTVFGNQYAGKSAKWFYLNWKSGYKAFNEATRRAYNDGFVYTASFDLTACFDSLDHSVLCYFLQKIKIEKECCERLSQWLGMWTATSERIFHNHGIPQGPQPSGLISEVVLAHFDTLSVKGIDFRYLRYVDDIRLFAKSEQDLRHLLVKIDLLSKDVGLFPQSSKISIHKITDIDEEIKSISNPPEAVLQQCPLDQKKLQSRIRELTPNFKIKDLTKFRFLLGHAEPNAALTKRLWRIYEHHPEEYRSICTYLRRYKRLPRVAASDAVRIIKDCSLYESVRADFISAVDGQLPQTQDAELALHIKKQWAPKSVQPDLLVSSAKYLARTGSLRSNQIVAACRNAESWWARATLVDNLETNALSPNSRNRILDKNMGDDISDVAISAALKSFAVGRKPESASIHWNKSGEILLKEVGLIRRNRTSICGISYSFSKIDRKIPSMKWQRLFGANYKQAEVLAVNVAATSGTDPSTFVSALDVFNDLLLCSIFSNDSTVGVYKLGNIGGVLHSSTSSFAIKYPATFSFACDIHQKRLESYLSHPLTRNTGKPTGPIRYSYVAKAKRLLIASFSELNSHSLL